MQSLQTGYYLPHGLVSTADFERNYDRALENHDLVDKNGQPKTNKYPTFGGTLAQSNKFALTKDGLQVVRLILCIIEKNNPQIELCPMLPNMVAILLHHLSPGDTLGAAQILVRRALDKKPFFFIPVTASDTTALYHVFAALAVKHTRAMPRLKQFESDGSSFLIKWMNSFLVDMTTLFVSMRIMDSFLVEGYKILLRYGMASLTLRTRELLQCTGATGIDLTFVTSPVGSAPIEEDVATSTAYSFAFSRSQLNHPRIRVMDVSGMQMALAVGDKETLSPTGTLRSSFLKEDHWEAMLRFIPRRFRHLDVRMLFSTDRNGYHLQTMYAKCGHDFPQLLFIQTVEEAIIGAFLTESWSDKINTNRFFGSAETFLFQLTPQPEKYQWIGIAPGGDSRASSPTRSFSASAAPAPAPIAVPESSSLFMWCTSKLFAVGGGGLYFGLSMDDGLLKGTTGTCLTFNNPPLGQLTSRPEGELQPSNVVFDIRHVEIWCFA